MVTNHPCVISILCHTPALTCCLSTGKGKAQKAKGGDRRYEYTVIFLQKKKIDKCVVYEHVRLAREGMHAAEECTLMGKAFRSRVLLTAEEDLCVNVQESLPLQDTAA